MQLQFPEGETEKYFHVSLGNNFFYCFSWRPFSFRGPWATVQCASLFKFGPANFLADAYVLLTRYVTRSSTIADKPPDTCARRCSMLCCQGG